MIINSMQFDIGDNVLVVLKNNEAVTGMVEK